MFGEDAPGSQGPKSGEDTLGGVGPENRKNAPGKYWVEDAPMRPYDRKEAPGVPWIEVVHLCRKTRH